MTALSAQNLIHKSQFFTALQCFKHMFCLQSKHSSLLRVPMNIHAATVFAAVYSVKEYSLPQLQVHRSQGYCGRAGGRAGTSASAPGPEHVCQSSPVTGSPAEPDADNKSLDTQISQYTYQRRERGGVNPVKFAQSTLSDKCVFVWNATASAPA